MTKAWGPLGWATLHSIACLYPDSPSEYEKELLNKWFDSFQKTIVCEKCREHFFELLKNYKQAYPNWNASKNDVILFVLRAHNTVNRRINKPVYSPEECINLLRTNIPAESAAQIRKSYIFYIRNEWARDKSMSGITSIPHIMNLIHTEEQYWDKRSFSWDNFTITDQINPIFSRNDPERAPLTRYTNVLHSVRPTTGVNFLRTPNIQFRFLSG